VGKNGCTSEMIDIAVSSEGVLTVRSQPLRLPYPVHVAGVSAGRIVVLYDPDSGLRGFGQFHNLIALDDDGGFLWEADLPTTMSGDCYYAVISWLPLVASSTQSYRCSIDSVTGKIVEATFYK
jgi:hypothetical protein